MNFHIAENDVDNGFRTCQPIPRMVILPHSLRLSSDDNKRVVIVMNKLALRGGGEGIP
jgi:hypothetical protein